MQRVVKEIADLIGISGAIILCRNWGLRDLYVPVTIDVAHPIAMAIGLDPSKKLVEIYGGQRLSLPAEVRVLREIRDAAILKAIAPAEQGGEGLSHESAAVRYGVTRQQVGNIAKRTRERQELRESRQAFAGAEQ